MLNLLFMLTLQMLIFVHKPNFYFMSEILHAKIKKEITLELAFRRIIVYSFIFFAIGYIYDSYLYLLSGDTTLVTLDSLCLLLTAITMYLWKKKRISNDNTLLATMFIVSVNLFLTIIYKGNHRGEDTAEKILYCMCIFIIPVIFTSLTKVRIAPYVVTTLAVISYTIGTLMLKNSDLFMYMPILLLIYFGAPGLLNMLIIASKQIEREKMIVTGEKMEFFKKMNLNQEQMEMIINPPVRNKKEAEEMFEKMDKKIRNTLLEKVREVICSTENVRNILKQRLPDITDSELEISVLIIEGKTVSEICEIRHVSPSTITSTRSRLRRKLGLEENAGLKDYLTSIVNNTIIKS